MLTKETKDEVEYAKNLVMTSSLDERCKKQFLSLLNTAMMATNGISTEEKIQKITEGILGLALVQLTFIDAVDKKIESANKEKCSRCKAMIHAENVEAEEAKKKLIDEWKAANGISDDNIKEDSKEKENQSWMDVLKRVIGQPGMWIFLTILTISPYGVDIVKTILQFFLK